MLELLHTIEMPNYPRKVLTSKERRAKYFIFPKDEDVKQKKKYSSSRYAWKEYISTSKKKEIRLYDTATNEFVIKNSRVAGKEKWLVINGQKYYNGLYRDYEKGKILNELNRFYSSFLEAILPIYKYPLAIECELHDLSNDPISGENWDVWNRFFPYGKAFEDNLQKLGIIINDSNKYVKVPSHPIFHEIQEGETPKLIFKIYAYNT